MRIDGKLQITALENEDSQQVTNNQTCLSEAQAEAEASGRTRRLKHSSCLGEKTCRAYLPAASLSFNRLWVSERVGSSAEFSSCRVRKEQDAEKKSF